MTESNKTVRSGRHRAASRLRKIHVGALAGLAVIGLGLSVGTASADPTAEDWYKIRMCESTNNYSINTGNGYYGAYQFDLGTWRSVGGSGRPDQATPATQDALALALWRSRGWSPWSCARLVSLSSGTSAPVRSEPAVKPTPYPKLAKSTADRWSSRLFHTVLGREAPTSYSAALQAGQASKSSIALGVIAGDQHRGQLVTRAYRECLGRSPDPAGFRAYTSQLRSASLATTYLGLCGSRESRNRAHGSLATWSSYIYRGILGRFGTVAEVSSLTAYIQHHGQRAAVTLMVNGVAWRDRQLDTVYRSMLGRVSDASARRVYESSMSGRGVFSVAVGVALSSEFASKS